LGRISTDLAGRRDRVADEPGRKEPESLFHRDAAGSLEQEPLVVERRLAVSIPWDDAPTEPARACVRFVDVGGVVIAGQLGEARSRRRREGLRDGRAISDAKLLEALLSVLGMGLVVHAAPRALEGRYGHIHHSSGWRRQ
jgi:hypothetical protein